MKALAQGAAKMMLAGVVAACGTSLSAAGRQVEVVAQAPAGCQRIGTVRASAQGGHGEQPKRDAAIIELRNRAAEMGGDRVLVQAEEEKGLLLQLSGVTYRCGSGP